MGCCAGKPKEQPHKDVKQTTIQTQPGESPNKKKLTPEQAAEKRKVLQGSLAEGHSHPPAVVYPKMPPVSAIQQ